MAHANVVVVLNSRDATVSLLDPATYQEIGSISAGKEPYHLTRSDSAPYRRYHHGGYYIDHRCAAGAIRVAGLLHHVC